MTCPTCGSKKEARSLAPVRIKHGSEYCARVEQASDDDPCSCGHAKKSHRRGYLFGTCRVGLCACRQFVPCVPCDNDDFHADLTRIERVGTPHRAMTPDHLDDWGHVQDVLERGGGS